MIGEQEYPYMVVTRYETFEDDVIKVNTLKEALDTANKGDLIYKLVKEIK